MLWFVNQVADAVKEEFPNEFIGTFAYQYTRKPPKYIRPADNVLVVLCSIECDFSHPFSHPHNKSFMDDLKKWSQITSNIFIWDYVVNYRHYLLPHPNFGVLKENIQIFKDYNVTGILEQAQYQSHNGEFAELRAYVLGKLLWNPELDTDKLVEEFITGYYGSSAPYIKQYFDLVQDLVTPDSYLTYATKLDDPIFTKSFFTQARVILSKADEAADNQEIRDRVEMVQLGVIYENLISDYQQAVKDGLLDKFKKVVERTGDFQSSEGMKASKGIILLKEKFGQEQENSN